MPKQFEYPPRLGNRLFTFAVMADTHLRPEEGDESSPWEVNTRANGRARYVVALLNELAPDFVIHLGDIVHPVPELPTYARACEAARAVFAKLEKAIHYVPGNHDVGDKPNDQMPAGQIQERFVDAYEGHFGADYSSFDRGDCHFTLINAQIINTGFPREVRQWEWLEADLSANAGRRIFLCTHYPPYICEPDEASHYDNIDEPGRSRLLTLVMRYSVEALFCGHVHGFFYNRYGISESYTLPATSFFRQDYSELFRIEPADQFGRNDVEKLGFFLVTVYEAGHVVRLVRTSGRELSSADRTPRRTSRIETLHTKESTAPVGVHLRHPWNEITELPYNGPLEEFSRKRARNDYTLLALWELGIRKLRIPLTELLEEKTRQRLAALKESGHQITAFTFDPPAGSLREALAIHRDLIDAFEVVLQWRNKQSALPALQEIKRESNVPLYLAKIETSADKKRAGSRFSHFVSYGFRSTEIPEVDELLALEGARDAADGYVFRVGLDKSPWEEIRGIGALAAERRIKAVVNIRLAADNPAAINKDDLLIANCVGESLVAAFAERTLDVFLDTLVDLDRGYFPRHGMFDRRFNPRPSAFVFRHLNSFLSGLKEPITLGERRVAEGGAVCAFQAGSRDYYLMLPRGTSADALLRLIDGSFASRYSKRALSSDLITGEIIEVALNDGRNGLGLAVDPAFGSTGPSLLILER